MKPSTQKSNPAVREAAALAFIALRNAERDTRAQYTIHAESRSQATLRFMMGREADPCTCGCGEKWAV